MNDAQRKISWIPAFAGMTVLVLSACASHEPSRVPVTIMGTQGPGTVETLSARAGDTPERLAKKTNLDIAALIEMNGLVPGQHLAPGQRLNVPVPREITVIEGDTVDSISRAFGLDRNALMAENNLKKPVILRRGQKLKIPQSRRSDDDAPPPMIADAYDSRFAVDDLAPVTMGEGNAAAPITTTDTGAGTKIHSSASGTIVEQDLAPPSSSVVDAPASAPVAPPTETAMLTPPAEPLVLQKPEPPKPTGAAPTFSWPLNGSTLSGYGPKSGGRHNDGINIGAPVGTPVRAAAPGEVVYVGDNVAGFGNLVLVRHDGGYATAYAHVQNPTVKRGERVDRGQAIAQVGKTGNVTSPQLHFEIRKGTQAVNPSTYLP